MSPRCPHNMVNFGELAAEIISLLWAGTQPHFNGFRVRAPPMFGRATVTLLPIFLVLLVLSSFFPRLFSAVGDWMSTILLHMVWP